MKNKLLLLALLFLLVPCISDAHSAYFYLSPVFGSYYEEQEFSVNLFIATEGGSVNAAESIISFDKEKLEVLSVDISDSIFTLWVREPSFSNLEGKIHFVGGLPSPGFIGGQGKIMTIHFKARGSGKIDLSFSDSWITANDPQGTNVFSEGKEEPVYYINSPGLEITIDNEGDSTNPRPLLYLDANEDDLEVSHYEVEIKKDIFKLGKEETSPWQMPTLTPGEYLVLVRAIQESGEVVENAAQIVIDSIKIPEISFCPDGYRSGEGILYVSGNSLPNSFVLVSFRDQGSEIKQWEIRTDSQGSWFLKEEILVAPGVYEILAKTKDIRGAISESSESCFVSVSLSGFMLGSLIITYRALALIAIVLLIIFFNWLSYLVFKINKTKKNISFESHDLKNKFYKEYNELKQDIEKQLEIVREGRKERGLSEEEMELEKKLLGNLFDVERVLREELKDIEEID